MSNYVGIWVAMGKFFRTATSCTLLFTLGIIPQAVRLKARSRFAHTAGTESKKLWEKKLWELFDRPIAIDPDGRIEKVYRTLKPESHAAEILADLPDLCPE